MSGRSWLSVRSKSWEKTSIERTYFHSTYFYIIIFLVTAKLILGCSTSNHLPVDVNIFRLDYHICYSIAVNYYVLLSEDLLLLRTKSEENWFLKLSPAIWYITDRLYADLLTGYKPATILIASYKPAYSRSVAAYICCWATVISRLKSGHKPLRYHKWL